MVKVIAFSSFSIIKKPYGDPVVSGFEDLTPSVFKFAESAEGFIARAKEIDDLEHLSNFERDWRISLNSFNLRNFGLERRVY